MIIFVIVALIAGGCIGALIMGICCANNPGHDPNKERWWEDEQRTDR